MDISIYDIGCIAMDFDGVHTDNKVYLSENGHETVLCSREDGYGLDILRRWLLEAKLECRLCIVSTETNDVVKRRADKLGVECFRAIKDKSIVLNQIRKDIGSSKLILYIGNDMNDMPAFKQSDIRVCPSDAHPTVRDQADLVLKRRGGDGCIRELVEYLVKS